MARPITDRERKRAWAQAHPKKVQASRDRWVARHLEHHPSEAQKERARERARQWYSDNASAARAAARARHLANRAEANEARKQRRARNLMTDPQRVREVDRQSTARRTARKKRAQCGDPDLLAFYESMLRGDPCVYCGGAAMVGDHIVPLAMRGEHDWTNLTAACPGCNQRKNARSLLIFLQETP